MVHRNTLKRSKAKTIFRLLDLEQSKVAVLHSLGAASSQESYRHAIDEFIGWYCSEPRLAFNRSVVLRYRFFLEHKNLAPSTINVRMAAVRRLAYEASDSGLLGPKLAAGIRRVKGAKRLGARTGNWLSLDQSRDLLRGLALHIRTVPVPAWAKRTVDEWTNASGANEGLIFRRVNRLGKVCGKGITRKAIWHIVKAAAGQTGIQNLAPHDLRRTCARLCHLAGGELEQIQFLLGHASIETTERYLGCKQKLRHAVNDAIALDDA